MGNVEQGQHDGRQDDKGRDSRHERLRLEGYGLSRRAARDGQMTAPPFAVSLPLLRAPPVAGAAARVKLWRHASDCVGRSRRGVVGRTRVRAFGRGPNGSKDGAREEAARRQGAEVQVLDVSTSDWEGDKTKATVAPSKLEIGVFLHRRRRGHGRGGRRLWRRVHHREVRAGLSALHPDRHTPGRCT